MKIGISESILNAYHPRALELFYNTNNLRDIFDKLKDRDSDIGV